MTGEREKHTLALGLLVLVSQRRRSRDTQEAEAARVTRRYWSFVVCSRLLRLAFSRLENMYISPSIYLSSSLFATRVVYKKQKAQKIHDTARVKEDAVESAMQLLLLRRIDITFSCKCYAVLTHVQSEIASFTQQMHFETHLHSFFSLSNPIAFVVLYRWLESKHQFTASRLLVED